MVSDFESVWSFLTLFSVLLRLVATQSAHVEQFLGMESNVCSQIELGLVSR